MKKLLLILNSFEKKNILAHSRIRQKQYSYFCCHPMCWVIIYKNRIYIHSYLIFLYFCKLPDLYIFYIRWYQGSSHCGVRVYLAISESRQQKTEIISILARRQERDCFFVFFVFVFLGEFCGFRKDDEGDRVSRSIWIMGQPQKKNRGRQTAPAPLG
jgi:hypothetical protein